MSSPLFFVGFHSPLNRRARKSLHIGPTYNVSTSVTRANIRQWVKYNHVFHKISNFDRTEIAHTNDEKGGTKILMLAILCCWEWVRILATDPFRTYWFSRISILNIAPIISSFLTVFFLAISIRYSTNLFSALNIYKQKSAY